MRGITALLLLAMAPFPAPGAEALLRVGQPAGAAIDGIEAGPAGVLIVVAPAPLPLTREQAERLRAMGWTLVQANTAARVAAFMANPPASPLAFLIDADSVLRRIAPIRGAAGLIGLADSFEAGRQGYESACARCHGLDGGSDSYPYIKTLKGIGARMSFEEIQRRIHPVPMGKDLFSVRGHLYTARQLDALVTYVAGR